MGTLLLILLALPVGVPVEDPDDALVPRHLLLFEVEREVPTAAESFRFPRFPGGAIGDGGAREVPSSQEEVPRKDPASQEHFEPPHETIAGIGNHFTARAWRNDVWDGYLTQPAVLIPAGLAVSAAAISHWDKRLQHHWEGSIGSHTHYSDLGQYSLIGAVILVGALLPGEGRTWWDEWWTIGEAYGAASLTTFAIKTGVKRPRPGSAPGTGVGTHSFPSGHSTSAFTAATLIEQNSGVILGLPAYGLATFTAFERVEEGHHYPSDILAGAAIGVLSASIFDHLHWGTGPQGGGIARPPIDAKVGFVDGLHGFDLEFTFRF